MMFNLYTVLSLVVTGDTVCIVIGGNQVKVSFAAITMYNLFFGNYITKKNLFCGKIPKFWVFPKSSQIELIISPNKIFDVIEIIL